jgi:hypothetical protein
VYSWIWSQLPGPTWARAGQAVVLALAVVAVLFVWVFPAVSPHLPFNDGTVGP